jgi:hypothetical protein
MPKVIDQFPFEFYGEWFTAVLANNRKLYIPLLDMCDALGIESRPQRARIQESPVISDALVEMEVQRAYGENAVQTRHMQCLQLEKLPFWLGTLQTSRIKDKTKQEKIIGFQREFADVAWAAFRSAILPEDMLAEMDAALPPAQQKYLQTMDEAAALRHGLDEHGRQLNDLDERVEKLEARLKGTDFINPAQGKEYIDMVGLVAHLLKHKKKGNEGIVHAEIKRQFQVPSYHLIPENEFDTVKKYLGDWYRRLAGPGAAIPKIFDNPSQKRLL